MSESASENSSIELRIPFPQTSTIIKADFSSFQPSKRLANFNEESLRNLLNSKNHQKENGNAKFDRQLRKMNDMTYTSGRKIKQEKITELNLYEIEPESDISLKRVASQKHYHQISTQNQIEKSNYKHLLMAQVRKNKDLEMRLYQLEKKYTQLHQINANLVKDYDQMKKSLQNQINARKSQANMIKDLDQRVKMIKKKQSTADIHQYLTKEKKQTQRQLRQFHKLREENIQYNAFVSALTESLRILKGKSIKNLSDLWIQWKNIIETASLNKLKLG